MRKRSAAPVWRRVRFAAALAGFLRHRLTLAQAEAIVRARMAARADTFLALMDRAVFARPASPYAHLFRLAGCAPADLRAMVRARGLEATLQALHAEGVYLTYEEFKGQTPIVRHGREIPAGAGAFDNPLLRRTFAATSGGTTGPPVVVHNDLAHIHARAAQQLVAYAAHGVLGAPSALWRGVLPDGSGFSNVLRGVAMGQVPERWFVPVVRETHAGQAERLGWLVRWLELLGRLHGLRIPRPELVPFERAALVAEWLREARDRAGRALLRCHVSLAVRVAAAARERGWDLHGATIMGGGEPPTPAKVAEVRRSGATWVPNYSFTEGGTVGFGCAHPVGDNDIHLFQDMLALIQVPRRVPGWEVEVGAYVFTALSPTAPRVMVNVESDDYGIVETRACGCPLEAYGFTVHLRETRSYRKITTEGTTILGSALLRILEEVLPARFGGTPLDYQLVEEEVEARTRLILVVSPRIRDADEAALRATVLEHLGARGRAYLEQSGALQVRRAEPVWTGRGKLLPLHLRPGSAGDGLR